MSAPADAEWSSLGSREHGLDKYEGYVDDATIERVRSLGFLNLKSIELFIFWQRRK